MNKKKDWKEIRVDVEMPEGVTAEYSSGMLKVTGPNGTVEKKLRYPGVNIFEEEGYLVIHAPRATQREKKIAHTFRAHIRNMFKGVTEGFEYKLKVVYSQFPITVEAKEGKLLVKNFLGEKVVRNINFPEEDVSVKVNKEEITVNGIDKEKAGQVAADIEQLTKISHLDRRIIQDGIYIVKKPHRSYV